MISRSTSRICLSGRRSTSKGKAEEEEEEEEEEGGGRVPRQQGMKVKQQVRPRSLRLQLRWMVASRLVPELRLREFSRDFSKIRSRGFTEVASRLVLGQR